MKVHFLLLGIGDDLLIANNKSRVQEIDQIGMSVRFDVTFQHSKVIDLVLKCCPIRCQISCPDTEDIFDEVFITTQVGSMLWEEGVIFVVYVVEGCPYHSC